MSLQKAKHYIAYRINRPGVLCKKARLNNFTEKLQKNTQSALFLNKITGCMAETVASDLTVDLGNI